MRKPLYFGLLFTLAVIIAVRIAFLFAPSDEDVVLIDANETPLARKIEPADTVQIMGFVTGSVEAPPQFLIDQNDPEVPDKYKKPLWVPVIAYAVSHPSGGVVILDTGMRAGDCSYGLRPLYWVPCRTSAGSDLVTQLQLAGIPADAISAVVVSHFHGDHVSGLSSLLKYADAPVLLSETAVQEFRSPLRVQAGVIGSMFPKGMEVVLLDPYWQDDETLGRYADVFGDGTLKLFETPGHTKGHVSALVQGPDHPVLLTFDAAHLEANVAMQITSSAARSMSDAEASLALFEEILKENPDVEIIYGHEPSQWPDAPHAANLGAAHSRLDHE